jgi:hypothetical protein
MPDGIRWVGLDVHARESTFAVFDQATGESGRPGAAARIRGKAQARAGPREPSPTASSAAVDRLTLSRSAVAARAPQRQSPDSRRGAWPRDRDAPTTPALSRSPAWLLSVTSSRLAAAPDVAPSAA